MPTSGRTLAPGPSLGVFRGGSLPNVSDQRQQQAAQALMPPTQLILQQKKIIVLTATNLQQQMDETVKELFLLNEDNDRQFILHCRTASNRYFGRVIRWPLLVYIVVTVQWWWWWWLLGIEIVCRGAIGRIIDLKLYSKLSSLNRVEPFEIGMLDEKRIVN